MERTRQRRRSQKCHDVRMARILVVDNYDSFVYNIVQYLAQLGAEVTVWRNDDVRLNGRLDVDFDGVLLSPGPGTPEEAGSCIDIVRSQAGKLPIFGVCLGLQSIAVAFGGVVGRAPELRHGKTSPVLHDDQGVFAGIANPMTATRYHSLAIDPATVPACIEVSARTKDGIIMAIRHRDFPIESVQFHPESVLTEGGYQMLANWLAVCGDKGAPERARGVTPFDKIRER